MAGMVLKPKLKGLVVFLDLLIIPSVTGACPSVTSATNDFALVEY